MIKKIIYILLLSFLFSYPGKGQNNFFWSHATGLRCLYDNATYIRQTNENLTNLRGIFFKPDGSRMYAVYGGAYIRQWDLSTNWDISTRTWSGTILLENQAGGYYGITFSADGSKMYVVDVSSRRMEQYNLSTSWNITTFSFSGYWVYGGTNFTPYGCTFSENGEYVYLSGFNTLTNHAALKNFYLEIPWDTSTDIELNTYDYGDDIIYDLQFHLTGLVLFTISNTLISQYNSIPAWSIKNLKGKCVFGPTNGMRGIYISPDYKRLYLSDTYDGEIKQYKLFD